MEVEKFFILITVPIFHMIFKIIFKFVFKQTNILIQILFALSFLLLLKFGVFLNLVSQFYTAPSYERTHKSFFQNKSSCIEMQSPGGCQPIGSKHTAHSWEKEYF